MNYFLIFIFLFGCVHKEVLKEEKGLKLTFDYKASDIEKICNNEQAALLKEIDKISSIDPKSATFSNSLEKLEHTLSAFSNRVNNVIFMKYVSTDKEVRQKAHECENAVEKLLVDIFLREDLYHVVKAVKKSSDSLDATSKKLLDEYILDFQRNGLDLPKNKRKIFGEKKKELVTLESDFSKNLIEWKDFLIVSKEELEGMEKSYIDSLEKVDENHFKIKLEYPQYFPFMENAKNSKARQKLEIKFLNRGGQKNVEILEKAISIRHELAKMLGKPTHADFRLERNMAKDSKTVLNFLNTINRKLKPKGLENLNEMLELKTKETGKKATEIKSYEWRYYENELKKTKYSVDTQQIKKYFPLNIVIEGMFEIYQNLLGVKFVKDEQGERWHDSVQRYIVKSEGKTVGIFFMDLFSREGKYSHAAAFTILKGYALPSGDYNIPVSAIVANFSPPTKDDPSFLTHEELKTLFHEFGHIMHQVLTRAKYAYFSGTSVKHDFVETPSQMFENWCWEKEPLKKMSGYYGDKKKPIPDKLIDDLIRSKFANIGIRYLRQISFGLIDMAYHTSSKVNTTKVYKKISKETMMISLPDNTIPQASFGHLMGGYDAGYYGYLWSEVYAHDLFSKFEQEGLFNSKLGTKYRKTILERGGEVEPMNLITTFLDRESNMNAFLKHIGL